MALISVKSLILILLVSLGVAFLSTGCNYRRRSSSQSIPVTNIAAARSGKVLIRFKEFEFGKDWAADFEITNDTMQPLTYVGHNNKDRFTYCTLAAKRQEKYDNVAFTVRDACVLGTLVSLQTLEPGQSVVLAARKNEIQDMLHVNDASSVATQIGFEAFVGDDRHREIVWSDPITFPNADAR